MKDNLGTDSDVSAQIDVLLFLSIYRWLDEFKHVDTHIYLYQTDNKHYANSKVNTFYTYKM